MELWLTCFWVSRRRPTGPSRVYRAPVNLSIRLSCFTTKPPCYDVNLGLETALAGSLPLCYERDFRREFIHETDGESENRVPVKPRAKVGSCPQHGHLEKVTVRYPGQGVGKVKVQTDQFQVWPGEQALLAVSGTVCSLSDCIIAPPQLGCHDVGPTEEVIQREARIWREKAILMYKFKDITFSAVRNSNLPT
ncbi:hypothetical protein RRG08_065610 [Elysia crispata]|uniref:Uncharacterized protein n=1 Tax=Elysia crispata TaxID=231223 RepID=A0AAE0YNA0_9GAST|nr:hypothetical protein RRG08_065610 [Elysia crispata]